MALISALGIDEKNSFIWEAFRIDKKIFRKGSYFMKVFISWFTVFLIKTIYFAVKHEIVVSLLEQNFL